MVVILEPDAVPALRLTVDEYLQADLPEGYRYELVDAVVTMSPNPGRLHEEIRCELSQILFLYRASHPDKLSLVTAGGCVPVPGVERVREPDLVAYAPTHEQEQGWSFWRKTTPVIVIEVVSRGQAYRDYYEKRNDYWKAGVGEYWIVDPEDAAICVLTREPTGWQERTVGSDDEFTSRSLPGLIVRVDEVLGQR